jgi:CRP-like cAMP-binding protein
MRSKTECRSRNHFFATGESLLRVRSHRSGNRTHFAICEYKADSLTRNWSDPAAGKSLILDTSDIWQTTAPLFSYRLCMGLIQEYEQASKTPTACAAAPAFGNGTQLNHKAARVRHLPLFSGISPAACVEIVSAAHEKVFSRGQAIFFQDDPEEQVILLTSGSVKTTQLGRDGTEVILRLNGPGDLIGATDLGSRSLHRSTARASVSSKAFVWNATVFEALLARFPIVRNNAARMLGGHLRELEERFREISTENVPMRLGHEIVRLANRVGERVNDAIKISLSCEELAQLTGTTLFTVSRHLSQWKDQGIVSTRRREVMVHDPQALAELSERD